MDLSGSAMSIPDENLKLFVPLRRNLGNIEFGLALHVMMSYNHNPSTRTRCRLQGKVKM